MASPVRVVMVAAASYFRKAGPHKVMRKRFNNVLGHVCTSAEWDVVAKRDICRPSFWGPKFGPQNGGLVTIFSSEGPHFGVQSLDPKTGALSQSFLHRGPILGSKFWTPKWGPPGVVLSVPARFPKTFSASKSLGLHRHGWLRVSPFCLAVTLIAAANVAFLRTGEAPCSATGFCADFLTPIPGSSKVASFCCKAAGSALVFCNKV